MVLFILFSTSMQLKIFLGSMPVQQTSVHVQCFKISFYFKKPCRLALKIADIPEQTCTSFCLL